MKKVKMFQREVGKAGKARSKMAEDASGLESKF